MRLFTLLTIFTIFAAAPHAQAQGFFEEGAKQAAAEEEEASAPAKEWTKQQLASIVIDATSPVFTLAEVGSEANLDKARELLRENKKTRQATIEKTFTRDELYALHEFYSTFHGSSIGAKLGVGVKIKILNQLK